MKKLLCVFLLGSCVAPQEGDLPPFVKTALATARGVGDAILRQKGFAEIYRSLPELIPAIDSDPADGTITLKEVEGFLRAAATDPHSVALLVATLVLLKP